MKKELLLLVLDEELENTQQSFEIEQYYHSQNRYNIFKSPTESFVNNNINLKNLFYRNSIDNIETNILFFKNTAEGFILEEQLLEFKKEFPFLNINIIYLNNKYVYYPLVKKLKNNNIKVLINTSNLSINSIITTNFLQDNPIDFYIKAEKESANIQNHGNNNTGSTDTQNTRQNTNNKKRDTNESNKGAKIITISSPKPGSGKSFIASNLAVALGCKKERVCLIEGDFQTTSVYNNFKIEINPKYNLYTAIKFVKDTMLNENKNILEFSIDNHRDILKFLQQCVVSKYGISILAMPHLDINNLSEVDANVYYYIINLLGRHFDYIIIDSNSSLSHETTIPILALSDKIIYLITLNENSIKNAANYKLTINQLGEKINIESVGDKFYEILNESSKDSFYKDKIRKIKNSNSFNIVNEVPEMNKKDFHYAIDEGKPLYLENPSLFSKFENKKLKEFKKSINALVDLIKE